MKYYKSQNLLLSHNLDTNVLRVRNVIGVKQFTHTLNDFKGKPLEELSKEKFNELLNSYYRNNREEWKFDNKIFRSMENFETDKLGNITNYDFDSIPKHPINETNYRGLVTYVYHQGRVYYMEWRTGTERCRLIDTVDLTPLKWVRPKNCSPIMCKTDKKII